MVNNEWQVSKLLISSLNGEKKIFSLCSQEQKMFVFSMSKLKKKRKEKMTVIME